MGPHAAAAEETPARLYADLMKAVIVAAAVILTVVANRGGSGCAVGGSRMPPGAEWERHAAQIPAAIPRAPRDLIAGPGDLSRTPSCRPVPPLQCSPMDTHDDENRA